MWQAEWVRDCIEVDGVKTEIVPFETKGDKILEVSFGSGYLMTQYASRKYEIHGIDYNDKMVEITKRKMKKLIVYFIDHLKNLDLL